MWRENCMTVFKIFKRDFPKVLKNGHSCLLLSGTHIMSGPVNGKNQLTFDRDQVPDSDSSSLFRFPRHCGIAHFRRFISMSFAFLGQFAQNLVE